MPQLSLQLSEKQKEAIQNSLSLKPEIKMLLLEKWNSCSENKQRLLLQMLEMAQGMDEALLEKCAADNPSFHEDLHHFIDTRSKKAIADSEADDHEQEKEMLHELEDEIAAISTEDTK